MPSARARKRDDFYRDRRRRKVCAFCADKTVQIDYKEINRLRRYLSERAKIEPRRKTGTCAEHQRHMARALKQARPLRAGRAQAGRPAKAPPPRCAAALRAGAPARLIWASWPLPREARPER